ncbi:MAG: hypothetical protein HRJ53_15795 [Acidobacteria bacterium Pan2503]|uniref:Uncharacterized protein n=1 Tax=Candidatus Acidiferrum panamense TaxID=2741543 RepID=A0A7V8SXW4_9BACT|nr:hypothetical protein [Candidatus Acidoferrum panamensis]
MLRPDERATTVLFGGDLPEPVLQESLGFVPILFRSGSQLVTGYGSVLFTERARSWFAESWGNYVEFLEFPTTER